ncbi:MAG TPA: RNA 2',3'-cyclic phosphodiesterase [Bacteroidota bacterium]
MSKIRTFFAIDTPEPIRDRILEVQTSLRERDSDVRWESRDKFHITLKFLGAVEEATLHGILDKVANALAPVKTFRLDYQGLGCFPNTRYPRVIWLGCENRDGSLVHVQQTIEAIVEPFGYEKEKRPFHPHITLGRVKGTGGIPELVRLMQKTLFELQTTECQEILAMKSDLRPTGSVYSVLRRIPLQTSVSTS